MKDIAEEVSKITCGKIFCWRLCAYHKVYGRHTSIYYRAYRLTNPPFYLISSDSALIDFFRAEHCRSKGAFGLLNNPDHEWGGAVAPPAPDNSLNILTRTESQAPLEHDESKQ
ncbi:MAG: hypothetical protein AAB417_01835 [Patescibacteria group bacterium]